MLRTTQFRHVRIVIPLLVLALIAAACAGDVGKYRDVAAGRQEGTTDGFDASLSPADAGDGLGGLDASAPDGTGGRPEDGVQPEAGGPGEGSSAPRPPGSDATGQTPAERAAPQADGTSEEGDIGITPTQIAVGFYYPRSGYFSALARNAPVALQTAFDEINEQGGVHGRQLVLKSYDDAGGDAQVVAANHRRGRDQAFAYLSLASVTNEILAPLADRDGVPTIVGNIPGDLARSLRYVFAAYPYITTQAAIMPSYIVNRLNGSDKRIGVVFENSQTALGGKDTFKTHAARAGLNVVAEQPVQPNQSTCTNEVTNLQSRDVELVVMINTTLAAICMLRDARTLGYRPVWTGLGSLMQSNAVPKASAGAAEGMTLLSSYTTLETPAGRHYSAMVRKYHPDLNAAEDDVGLFVYGQGRLLIQALLEAGPDLSRERFVETMETRITGFDSGYLPPPKFGPGDRSAPQAVAVVGCCNNNDNWKTTDPTWRGRF